MKVGKYVGVIENEPEDVIRELPVCKKREEKKVAVRKEKVKGKLVASPA